jgi:hypothetical protein
MIFGNFFDGFDSIQDIESIDRVINALGNPIAARSLRHLNSSFLANFSEQYSDQQSTPL